MVQPITAEERKGRSFWLEAPWGHLLYVLGRFLRGHLRRCKWSVEWRDVSDVYLTKRPTQVIFETVGAGARKSACFLDLLGWTVVSHERLRSRCIQFCT